MKGLGSALRLLAVVALPLACGGGDSEAGSGTSSGGPDGTGNGGATSAVFLVPGSLEALSGKTFFDHPWPSDVRRNGDGTVRFEGWPNPSASPLVDQLLVATKGLLRGFSPTAAAYLRFTGAIDPATLPASPSATGAPDSAVQLVDVDPGSPERGSRRLVATRWLSAVSEESYYAPNTLAVMPLLGRPLRPKTRYAAVVTRKVRAAGGAELGRPAALAQALGLAPADAANAAVRELFASAVTELGERGVPASEIAHMTVFTTDDPTAETFAAIDDVPKSVPAPTPRDWVAKDDASAFDVYEGSYGPSPNYQSGKAPYRKPEDGGGFVLAGDVPKLQNTFDLRFALAVPKAAACPPPSGGYPVVLYAHGTGGDYRSFVTDGTAASLASQCLASMGIDQIFHGTRPGAPPASDPTRDNTIAYLFFNFDNPLAGRTNNRQAAVDLVQQARLFTEGRATVPAQVSRTGASIAFDPAKVMFFGHSQGGLNGPLFLAATDEARGGVLSGAGSVLGIALLEKTQPIDITKLVRLFVCGASTECATELDIFHPGITLAQSIVDASDPVHYASFIATRPRTARKPKSVFQTEGVNADGSGDTFAPPRGIEALSVAMGLPRILPGIRARAEATALGIGDVTVGAEGLSGNLAGGGATGVLAQFAPKTGKDGHFVVFDVPEARSQSARFLRALADDPKGRFQP